MHLRHAYELGRFQPVTPRLTLRQEDALEWLAAAHAKAAQMQGDQSGTEVLVERMRTKLRRFGCKPNQIATRGFDTFDPKLHDFAGDGLYALGNNAVTGAYTGPNSTPLGERSQLFLDRSSEIFRTLYPETAAGQVPQVAPDHLVHVSCTGYVAPSAPQRLVNERGWQLHTSVTHSYHMGCYGAFPAVRMAEGFGRTLAARGQASHRIDVVHTELCTLHLNPASTDPDQLVVHTLFADGHIKYSLLPPGSLERGFKVLQVTEQLVPDSLEDMSWIPDSWGFRMGLSREVPRKIQTALRPFMQRLAADAHCDLGELMRTAKFAVHPGGPRIIDAVQEILELKDEQTKESKAVLLNRGNMSSATLPHVWAAMDSAGIAPGTKVVSLAFGPGLSIFGAVFVAI